MSTSSNKRITKELSDITTSPPPGYDLLPISSNIHAWTLHLAGPASTPYAGGKFKLHLVLPANYPFAPPTLSFATKIYHPNVTNDDKGSMCLGLLRPDVWKPSSKIREVLEFARHLLEVPDVEDAVEGGIAAEIREGKGVWERKAREWTGRYAKG